MFHQELIIQQMGYDAVEMIQLHQSRIQCRLVENTVMDYVSLHLWNILMN